MINMEWLTAIFENGTWKTVERWFIYNSKEPILFNSALFLGMFLVFYPLYSLIAKSKTHFWRNLYVVAFSLFFYYKSSGLYFGILIFTGLLDYNLARLLHQETLKFYRKFFLYLSVAVNLSLLGYFKYNNFFIDNYNGIFASNLAFHDLILPVGISFFTFQSMSYVIDIYRHELEPTKRWIDYMFYLSFFPQLVAGPIVRASEFIPQMYQKLNLSREDVNKALFLIIGGVLKKAVISDYISLNFVDRVFDAPNSYTAFENWMASYGYTIQIYCDFSGYSDMAIGIALLMGFKLSLNFRTPYKSGSITEFWRRWHISLSSWLRDYLYISLGGNRKGKFRTYVNLFLTMLLGGLWHGASWKFVAWGVLHGSALVMERLFKEYFNIPKNYFVRFLGIVITFHFVVFCWIFFRARDFATAFQVIENIGKVEANFGQWWTIIQGYQNVFLVMLIGFVWHFLPEKVIQFLQDTFGKLPIVGKALVLAFVFWIVFATASSGPQPFIYFQF
jgi:D-alanyl-lipoteichoic acid acyltransferase DltB (MBOAT superfamily)